MAEAEQASFVETSTTIYDCKAYELCDQGSEYRSTMAPTV